jgi:hypothetical protein
VGVNLGLLQWGRATGCVCSAVGYWGRHLGLRGRKWQETGEKCEVCRFIVCSPHRTRLILSHEGGWDGRDMWHVQRGQEIRPVFCWKESTWKIENRMTDDIKMDLKEIGWNDMDGIDLFQDKKKGTDFCQHGNEHPSSIKCGEFWTSWGNVSLSSGSLLYGLSNEGMYT